MSTVPPHLRLLPLLPVLLTTAAAHLAACDSCGCHMPSALVPADPGWNAGLMEQYTDFGTLQDGGRKVDNRFDQSMQSSTTQLTLGYRCDERWAVSAFIPYISRSYSRPDGGVIEHGTVAGLGDATLVGSCRLLSIEHLQDALSVGILAGVKIPTGDPAQLKYEEQGGGDQDPASATGGHDLALGSGAWDPLGGLDLIGRLGRWYAQLQGTYTYNTEGAYEYRYANEIAGSVGIGYFVYVQSPWRIATQLNLSGSSKGLDTVAGTLTDDTANHDLFAGAECSGTYLHALSGDLAVDLPVIERNSAIQLVPTWRLRAALTVFF